MNGLQFGPGFVTDELTGFLTYHSVNNFLKSEQKNPDCPRYSIIRIEFSRIEIVYLGVGSERADQVTVALARRLVRLFPQAKAFIRWSNNTYGVLLDPGVDLMAEIDRLQEFAQRPLAIGGEIIVFNLQIGAAGPWPHDRDLLELVHASKAALMQAKAQNRPACLFEPWMLEQVRHAHRLQNDLRLALMVKSVDVYEAVNNAEFTVQYQPIVRASNGRVHGFEALMRWNHPELGEITPDVFIPLAEQINVIPLLGNWIMRKAMVDAMAWPADADGHLPVVSINLSGVQFGDPHRLMGSIRSAIAHSRIAPGRVNFEVTESTRLSSAAKPWLDQLRTMGCTLAIDDFGSGYSALNLLVDLPVNYVKIDMSLVRDLAADDPDTAKRARRLVNAIVNLARSLEIEPVVEGIETVAALDIVRILDADLIQGHVFAPALPASAVGAFLAAQHSNLVPRG